MHPAPLGIAAGKPRGYSTLWLAEAARRLGGHVTTLALLPAKAEMALGNGELLSLKQA